MKGGLRALVLATTLQLLIAGWVIPAQSAASEDRTFADNFTSGTYSGNEGSHDFNGPWRESGDDGSSSSGHVYLYNHPRCPTDNVCLAFGNFNGAFVSGLRARRHADTLGANSIEFSFQYRRWTWEADNFFLDVQVNDGSGWNTLDSISLADTWDTNPVVWRRDITPYASADMKIRFRTSGGSAEGYILIDDVEIQATIDVAPTTTTTTTPPTATTDPTGSATTTTAASQETPTTPVGAPDRSTTTAVPGSGSVDTAPSGSAERAPAGSPLSPDQVDDYSSKAGMFLNDVMPTLGVPASMPVSGEVNPSVTIDRSPIQGLMATFETSTETFQGHGFSVVLLGLLVAWLSLRGLGRSRWTRGDHVDRD